MNPVHSLLSKVRDLELVNDPSGNVCCGMGVGLDRKNEEVTVKMATDLLSVISASGASMIISNDPLCLMHLNGVIQKQKLPLQTIHLADVLASGWE